MHKERKLRAMNGRGAGTHGKTVVLGILERASEGKPKRIRTSILNDRKNSSIQPEVQAHVETGSKIYSDEFAGQWKMPERYEHETVNHLERYVQGNVHTNGIENFWSLLKRGLGGTCISVEPFHLFRYVDEQAFRFNNRKHADGELMTDYERFKAALNQVVGRRLTYKALTGKGASSEAEAAF